MSLRRSATVPVLYPAMLRCASWLVPIEQRREWSAEWFAELWYVSRSCERDGCGLPSGSVVGFCLGAFQDAFWIRRNSPQFGGWRSLRLESAWHCGVFLSLLVAAGLALLLIEPGARRAALGGAAPTVENAVQISRDGDVGLTSPTISVDEYEAWRVRRQTLFTEFAFYHPTQMPVREAGGLPVSLKIAQASENIFQVLKIPVDAASLASAKAQRLPAMVLSESAWRSRFDGDPRLLGSTIELGGEQAVVAGILPDERWRFGRHMDAWLLEGNSYFEALPQSSLGYVVARMSKQAISAQGRGRWQMSVTRDGATDSYVCVPVNEAVERPFAVFLFTLVLACLALPATTPLPLGDYPAAEHSLAGARRWSRWMFLGMKIALTIPIVYCLSIGAAYLSPAMSAANSEYIELSTSFLALLFSFRWALRDQRSRCPVCLRLLTNPARVGHPSRNFLAWHGTEFMCGEGHGLLHVPEIATTWFDTQRWLYLDPSWKGLFPEPYAAPSVY